MCNVKMIISEWRRGYRIEKRIEGVFVRDKGLLIIRSSGPEQFQDIIDFPVYPLSSHG